MSVHTCRLHLRPVAVALVLSVSLSACFGSIDLSGLDLCNDVGPLAAVRVAPSQVTLRVGDSVQVSSAQLDAKGNDRFLCGTAAMTWSSNSTAIATIAGPALGAWVRGVAVGQTTIRANTPSHSGTATVTVTGS